MFGFWPGALQVRGILDRFPGMKEATGFEARAVGDFCNLVWLTSLNVPLNRLPVPAPMWVHVTEVHHSACLSETLGQARCCMNIHKEGRIDSAMRAMKQSFETPTQPRIHEPCF